MRLGFTLSLLTLGPLLLSAGQPALRPILPDPLPDPYVFQWAGDWMISGTGRFFYHGSALRPEAMIREDLHLLYEDAAVEPAQGIWGFIPFRHSDGSWHGYATLHYGGFRTVVAHFLPQAGATWRQGKPFARWRFDRVLVGDLAAGKTTAYESKMVSDEAGTLYLVYSASRAARQDVHIYAQRMLDPGRIDPASPPRSLLDPEGYRSEDRNPGFIQIVEGANLFKCGSKYVLLYSVGDFVLDNYKLGVAYSDQLVPPPGQTYRKVLIPDPENLWKNTGRTNEICYLLQSEQPRWPNYCRPLVSGPGLGNLVTIGRKHWLVFHGYSPADKLHQPRDRYVWALPLRVNIDETRPMQDWLLPDLAGSTTLPSSEIPPGTDAAKPSL
jgi:hypothetical protein